MQGVAEIVLTGGDCSGKTTGIAYLSEKLAAMNCRVFQVPEIASIIIGGGVSDIEELARNDPEGYYQIGKQMLHMQLNLRSRFQGLAAVFPKEKRVILYDRGPMDPFAFMSSKMRERLLDDCDLDICQLRDTFDGVVHMTTTAKGAEHGYTRTNNPNRQLRSFDELCSVDDRLINIWLGNPHYRIVGSRPTFEEKLDYLFKTVCHLSGIPQKMEIERKFLCGNCAKGSDFLNVPCESLLLKQAYLKLADGSELRVRRRDTVDGHRSFFRTTKRFVRPGVKEENEDLITQYQYNRYLLNYLEKGTNPVWKRLDVFIYKNQVFELQTFIKPVKGLQILEIELLDENEPIELPPFITIDREVTNDPSYTSHAIARGSLG